MQQHRVLPFQSLTGELALKLITCYNALRTAGSASARKNFKYVNTRKSEMGEIISKNNFDMAKRVSFCKKYVQ